MEKTGQKFRGGVRYYHRHAHHANTPKAALDWREREKFAARERRSRVFLIGLRWVGVVAFVVAVFYWVIR